MGFLSLGSLPGNQGMHDQILAMKWVQQHISDFGGNPDNITIMGESAGAMSCMLHYVSPLSQGLFHKVIALSGTGSTPFLHQDRKPQHYGRALAHHLITNSQNYTDEDLIIKLRQLPAKNLAANVALFKDWDANTPLQFKPCLDPQAGSEAFMPIPFRQAVLEGKFNPTIPILTGCNSEEGLIFSVNFHKYPKRWDLLFGSWDIWAPLLFFSREPNLISSEDVEKSNLIKNKFFPQDMIPIRNQDNLKTLEEIFSSAIFQAPMVNDMKLLATKGVQIYAFDFAYNGTMTLADVFRLSLSKVGMNFAARHCNLNRLKVFQKDLGVCHGDDMFYYFTCK